MGFNKKDILTWMLKAVTKLLPVIIAAASATAAMVPRVDANGQASTIHQYLDVFALNIFNSAHDQGLIPDTVPNPCPK